MSDRTTSGAYRIPIVSPKPSDAASKIQSAHNFTSTKKSTTDYKNCNIVAQERIWKEHVLKEKNAAKSWNENWSFMTEFDPKGNAKPQKQLPEKVSPYDTSVPMTTNQAIGHRKDSTNNMNVRKLELMMSQHRRRSDIGANYY